MILNGDQEGFVDVLTNTIPSLMVTLSDKDFAGMIMCKEGETNEQINNRKVKMVGPLMLDVFEGGDEEDYQYKNVTVPAGSLVYYYADLDTGEQWVFTSSPLRFE